jgi:hypothetical protein
MLVSRGQIKEFEFIERIDVRYLFLLLKDHAMELEIQRDLYHDIAILTSNSNDPNKFTLLDKIQKLYNSKFKTSIEKLIEGYKEEFKDGKPKEVTIKFKQSDKKKVRDLVKIMKEK